MKEKKWIEERRPVLLKELVHHMLLAWLFFEDLYRHYKKSGQVSFQKLEHWIGTESHKGCLWNLKDMSHVLFRRDTSRQHFYENIFDWTLGSIFHEGMKLKENIYIIEAYQNVGHVFTERENVPEEVDIEELSKEYKTINQKAFASAAQEMENLRHLFKKVMEHLKKILMQNKNDALLIRFLIENEDQFDGIYGKDALKKLFKCMYEQGLVDVYLKVGKHYRTGGWYPEALKILNRALQLDPHHKEVKKEHELLRKKIKAEE